MARVLLKEEKVKIPDNCEVKLENKIFTFKGPLGEQKYDCSKIKFYFTIEDNFIRIRSWHGNREKNNLIYTIASHLRNNAKGVVKGYRFTIKAIYKHFSINLSVEEEGKKVVVRNFLGSKIPRAFDVLGECKAYIEENKDVLTIEGINLEHVSQTAANISNDCSKRKKNDTRVFLDGIFNIGKATIL